MTYTRSRTLCWICEKPISSEILSPFIYHEGVRASACDKHATYKWEVVDGKLHEVHTRPNIQSNGESSSSLDSKAQN